MFRRQPEDAAPSGLTNTSNLSLAELRGRLAALNENTSTPGVVGEERRLILLKRLSAAICGSVDEPGEGSGTSEEEEEEERTPEEVTT